MKRIKNLSTSCTSCTLNSHKRTNESSHRGKHIALAVLRTHRNRVRLECDSPNSRSRDPSSAALESFLERWSCALSWWGLGHCQLGSGRHVLLLLCINLFCCWFWSVFLFSLLYPPSVVMVVAFIISIISI